MGIFNRLTRSRSSDRQKKTEAEDQGGKDSLKKRKSRQKSEPAQPSEEQIFKSNTLSSDERSTNDTAGSSFRSDSLPNARMKSRLPLGSTLPDKVDLTSLSNASRPMSRPSLPPNPAEVNPYQKPIMVSIPKYVCDTCHMPCQGETLRIGASYFHKDCFICFACKVKLSSSPYFSKDGQIYCSKDFNRLFGTKCRACHQYIQGDVVAVLGFTYHPACFKCSRCERNFEAGQEVIIDKDEAYCEKCPAPLSLDICAGCYKAIKIPNQSLVALEKQWHPECLKCSHCGVLLTKEYFTHEDQLFCELDYLKQFGVKCNTCYSYIIGKVIEAGSKRYHPHCAFCSVCNGMFREGEDMLVKGDHIWHPACGRPPLFKSTSTIIESVGDDDIDMSDELMSYNVVTLDYSLTEADLDANVEIVPESQRKLESAHDWNKQPNAPPASLKGSAAVPPIGLDVDSKPLPNHSVFAGPSKTSSPRFSVQAPSPGAQSTSIPAPQSHPNSIIQNESPTSPGSTLPRRNASPRYFEKPPTHPRSGNVVPLRSSPADRLGSERPLYSTSTLRDPDDSRNNSFHQSNLSQRSLSQTNVRSDRKFSAPRMSEDLHRSKSSDRLRVFQPKMADHFAGGYLNPAAKIDVAPGVLQRFPNLKREMEEREKAAKKAATNVFNTRPQTRPGNLNNRRTLSSSGIASVEQPNPFSRGTVGNDLGNRGSSYGLREQRNPPSDENRFRSKSRRIDSDDYTNNSAKCFYDREKRRRSLERSLIASKERDRLDGYLSASGVGSDILRGHDYDETDVPASDDPRSASRSASAAVEPAVPLRFEDSYESSPSRILGYLELENLEDDAVTRPKPVERRRNNRSMLKRAESGGLTTDDSGLDCFSEPEGNTRHSQDLHRSYRSDIEPETTNPRKKRRNERRARLLHDNFISYMRALKDQGVTDHLDLSTDILDGVDAQDGLPVPANSNEVIVFSLELLRTTNQKLPKGVRRNNLEMHLSNEDFYRAFKMGRDAFYRLPAWKRDILKKLNYLF